MGSTRVVKRGDIWSVNLDPTVGKEINKTRPALIVQNDVGNKYSQVTIIAPITSKNISSAYPTDVFIESTDSGLKYDSKVLTNQIRAIDKKRLIRKIGNVGNLAEVNEALQISLGLVQF